MDGPPLIRLLNIVPGQRSDPIVCELHYVSTENPTYYKAILYCWGGQQPSVTVQCGLQRLQITENLNAAITTLRLEDKSLLLWADAICIDQCSVEEKKLQVPLMRLIYQQAAVVQVWLGEDTPDKEGQEAFYLLQELSHSFDKLARDFNIFETQLEGQYLDSCRLPAFSDPSWTSLFKLVRRPWFARVWIIQEVVVSRDTILRCGNARLRWKDFCFGFLFAIQTGFLMYQKDIFQHLMAFQQLIPLIITQVCFAEGPYPAFDLVSLLQNHRFAGATDHLDKVYALLGLMSEVEIRCPLLKCTFMWQKKPSRRVQL